MSRKRRTVPPREARIEPTPETLAKLQPDPLDGLPHEMKAAAQAIEAAYRLVTAGMDARAQDYTVAGHAHPPEDWSAQESRLYRRYVAWADEMTRLRRATGPVLDVIVDGMMPWEVERRRRLPSGTVIEAVLASLRLYEHLCLTRAA